MEAQELETAQLEARTIARQIRGLLGAGGQEAFQVFDKRTGGDRPATYRDIVILLRATQAWSPIIIDELKKQGIPAYAELSTGYFSATEVEVDAFLVESHRQSVSRCAISGCFAFTGCAANCRGFSTNPGCG